MTDPTARYNFKTGDQVVVKGWPPSSPMTVTDTSDRSLLTLELPSGCTVRVGRLACELVQNGNDSNTDTTQEATP